MAYYDQRTGSRERAVAAAIVALMQVGVIVALVNGLAVTFSPPEAAPSITGEQIKLPPPTAPRPVPPQKDSEPIRNSTQKPPPVSNDRNDNWSESSELPPFFSDPIREPPQQRSHPPSELGRIAMPANKPNEWVTQDDYSPSDIRSERQGTARFKLGVGNDGRVTSCMIIQSTGFVTLDAATCKLVSRRARFEPALDDSGAPVSGSYTGSIRWVIPE